MNEFITLDIITSADRTGRTPASTPKRFVPQHGFFRNPYT